MSEANHGGITPRTIRITGSIMSSGGGGIIPSGTKTIAIDENGTVTSNVTTYESVEVIANVPNSYGASDEGKVVKNGALATQTSTTKTANGTYDTTLNNEVAVSVPASAVDSGTKNISANGMHSVVGFANANVTVPNSYSASDEGKVVNGGELVAQGTATYTANGSYDTTTAKTVEVNVGTAPTLQNKTRSFAPTESVQSETITADAGYDGLNNVNVTVDAIPSSYVGSGISRRSSADLAVSGATVTAPSGYYAANASKAVASGTAGTPVATKGPVSNHSVSVTPSVTNTTGYINGDTKTGTAVVVSASELDSGSKNITSNGNDQDVVGYATVNVNVPNSYASGDEGKVVSNGALVGQTSATYTDNGTYDTTLVDSVTVNVSGGGVSIVDTQDEHGGTIREITAEAFTKETLTATDNGTYTAPTGTLYNEVVVNVSGGGGTDNLPSFVMGTLTQIDDATVTGIRDFAFRSYSGLTSVKVPNCTKVGNQAFYGVTGLTVLALPSIGSNNNLGGASIASSSIQTLDLGPNFNNIQSGSIQNGSNLNTLILRNTSLVSLANTSQFGGTNFASGKSGGTIYIPKSLYDHLGDGSSSDYKAASNWSVVDGYGTVTWASIEGSYYETHYADGTVIS